MKFDILYSKKRIPFCGKMGSVQPPVKNINVLRCFNRFSELYYLNGSGLIAFHFILFALIIANYSVHADTYYEADFVVTQTNFALPSKTSEAIPIYTNSWNGKCVFGGHTWWIENKIQKNATRSSYFDGTNVLETTRITSPPVVSETILAKLPPGLASALRSQASGTTDLDAWIFLNVVPGDHPLDNLGSNLPWLVFCSPSYLSKVGRIIPLPSVDTRFVPQSFGFLDKTTNFSDILGLPKSIDLIASVALLTKATRHESLVRVGRTAEEIRDAINPLVTLPEGFLKAQYRVDTSTNFEGVEIPLAFTYREYEHSAAKTSWTSLIVHGVITTLHLSREPDFKLSANQQYSVADYRFRDSRKLVDQIQYAITNGQIPPIADPKLQDLFRDTKKRASVDPTIKVHFWTYVLFVALLAGPVIIVLVNQLNGKKRNKIK